MARCKCVKCGKEYQCGCNAIHGLCSDCSKQTVKVPEEITDGVKFVINDPKRWSKE